MDHFLSIVVDLFVERYYVGYCLSVFDDLVVHYDEYYLHNLHEFLFDGVCLDDYPDNVGHALLGGAFEDYQL